MTAPTGWTDERCELLRKLWTDGLSASQIAMELNCGFSRNAVIGKAMRLALPKREVTYSLVPRTKPTRPKQTRSVVRTKGINNRARKLVVVQEVIETAPVWDTDIPLHQRKSLLELTPDTCRWPVGDPGDEGFFFCGATVLTDGKPYCALHSRVAYQPAASRRPFIPMRRHAA